MTPSSHGSVVCGGYLGLGPTKALETENLLLPGEAIGSAGSFQLEVGKESWRRQSPKTPGPAQAVAGHPLGELVAPGVRSPGGPKLAWTLG